MICELIEIFHPHLQSVRYTRVCFLRLAFARVKNLLTFAARKRGSGLFSEGFKSKIKNKKISFA